jgi:TonB-linked SusC/RagA family outer membrane protein
MLTLFTVVACLQAWSNGYTQTITLSLKNAPLEKVFKEIRKQTTYSFIYTKEEVSTANPITIHVKDASLNDVLNICLKDQPLSYTIVENHVVIKKKKEELNITEKKTAIPLTDVRGKVTNEKGEALEGITVLAKATNTGTSTNGNGEFSLNGLQEDAVLVFTGTNVERKEIPLKGRTFIEVTLQTKNSSLDEIQIIAYGTNTQRYNVGSVTKITSEEIARQPVLNPLAALQGRAAGLVVTATSGLPGASFTIQIRGQNNLNSNPSNSILPKDNPLFIVDGVPLAAQNGNINQFSSLVSPGNNNLLNNKYGGISPFNSINPQDIESIEILRDADATAIYGSRGANGVILITTKKGNQGKTRVNLNVYNGISHMPHMMRMMNTEEYLQMRREAFKNDGIVPNLTPFSSGYAPDLLVFDTTKYTDWKSYFLNGTAKNTDVNASVSGGSANTQFLLGSGFHRETYIYPGAFSYNRASVNFNLHHHSTDRKFAMDFFTNYSYDKNNSSASLGLLSIYNLEPDYPDLLDSQGNLAWTYKNVTLNGNYAGTNPISYLKTKYEISNNNLISNLQLAYSILPNLSIRSSFGYNSLNSDEYSGNPASSNFNHLASANFGSNNFDTWIIEPQVTYTKTVGNIRLNALIGASFQQNINSSTQVSASGYNNDALIGSVTGAPNKNAVDAYSQYKYSALFARLGYIWKSKYLINLSGRRDGSSRFGPGKQFGNFGSVGSGWIFSEEKPVKKLLPWLSYGKLRFSYGTTGSDAIADYQYLARWAPTAYSYQSSLGYLPQNLFNSEFSWSLTKKLEGGIEIGMLKDRLVYSLAWFRNRTGNQLINYQLPTQTGFASVLENWKALVQNTGWEFQLSASNIKTTKFNWNTVFNMSIPHNKLVSFPGIESSSYSTKYIVGKSLNALNKLKYFGVNDTTGLFQFVTANGAITYTPTRLSGNKFNDVQVIGTTDPKFYGGLGNNVHYNNWELNFFFEFKKQTGVNYLGQVYTFTPGQEYNLPESFVSRWRKPGDKSNIQRLTSLYSGAAYSAASYFRESSGIYSDASYVRLKTVSLSYRLPQKFLDKMRLQACRFFVNGENVLLLTNYKGNDPETQNFYGVPPLKTFVAGLQASF